MEALESAAPLFYSDQPDGCTFSSDLDEVAQSYKRCAADKSWRVRIAVTNSLAGVADNVSKEVKAKGKTCEQDVDTLITKKCKNKGLFSCQPRRLRNKLVESCKTCRADPEQCAKHANDLKQKREIREGMSKMQNHRDRVYQAMTL